MGHNITQGGARHNRLALSCKEEGRGHHEGYALRIGRNDNLRCNGWTGMNMTGGYDYRRCNCPFCPSSPAKVPFMWGLDPMASPIMVAMCPARFPVCPCRLFVCTYGFFVVLLALFSSNLWLQDVSPLRDATCMTSTLTNEQ